MSRGILKGFSYHIIVGEHISHQIARAGRSTGGAAGDGRMARAQFRTSNVRYLYGDRDAQCIKS